MGQYQCKCLHGNTPWHYIKKIPRGIVYSTSKSSDKGGPGYCLIDHDFLSSGRLYPKSWWCLQMETFSAILALCAGKSPVTAVTRSFDCLFELRLNKCPYPEPVYTGWSSVHWNATGMPLVDPVYTGIPLEKLSWNSPTLECHWRNLVESAPHWDATGETLTFAAYTGTPLECLWQPTHAPTHIVQHAE